MRQVNGGGNRRDFYRWRICALQASKFLNDFLPYLRTERVREKALLGLDFQLQKTTKARINRSVEYKDRQRDYFERLKELNRRGK